jgi:hypothetical protein
VVSNVFVLVPAGGPRLALEYPKADVRVISWASPRVGNKEFVIAFTTLIGTSLRFQYNYDAVPCVPMAYLGGCALPISLSMETHYIASPIVP